MDIDHFSDFARGSSETHQKLSEPIFVRGLPWKILAMPREQNRVRFFCLFKFFFCSQSFDDSLQEQKYGMKIYYYFRC